MTRLRFCCTVMLQSCFLTPHGTLWAPHDVITIVLIQYPDYSLIYWECTKLPPCDPGPINRKSTVAIFLCHGWFQHDQVHRGFRPRSQHLRNQLNRNLHSENMPLNGVANHILHFDERRASGFDRLSRKHPGDLQLRQDSALLRIVHTPIYIALPYMPQPGVNTLLARKL